MSSPRATKTLTRWILAATTTAVLGFMVPAVTSARRQAPPCRPRASHTIAANSTARVYTTSSRFGVSYYGCVYSTRRRTLLDEADHPRAVRLAGTSVAIATETGSNIEIVVRNLRSGSRLHEDEIGNANFNQSVLKALVLKPNGAVAWIVDRVDETVSPSNGEVGRHDSRGRQTVDTAPDGQLSSLRLAGSTLTWTHGTTTGTSDLR